MSHSPRMRPVVVGWITITSSNSQAEPVEKEVKISLRSFTSTILCKATLTRYDGVVFCAIVNLGREQ